MWTREDYHEFCRHRDAAVAADAAGPPPDAVAAAAIHIAQIQEVVDLPVESLDKGTAMSSPLAETEGVVEPIVPTRINVYAAVLAMRQTNQNTEF